ncbi:MAG: aquaporin family protein [Muribaculaceae bacterium]|nr:aquaporin family protein [Muribaculaceae bacterium]
MNVSVFLKCLFEFLGTFVMILLGVGVCACTSLAKSKGQGAGWIVVTLAWGLAVMCGVLIAGPYTGAHLNPAVTIGLASAGKFSWALVAPYIISQIIGALLGAMCVYWFYKDHFDLTDDPETKLGVFATIPAIKDLKRNFLSEVIGTFVLVLVILFMSGKGNTSEVGLGSIGAIPVSLLVIVIGMSLGGTTGYAINPARDLGPRLAHHLLPIKGKGSSRWKYVWVPILGPILGAVFAALVYQFCVWCGA